MKYFPDSHKGYKPFCTMTLKTQIFPCKSTGDLITVPHITCGESRGVKGPSRSFHYRLSADNYRRWQNQDWLLCTIRESEKDWSLLQIPGWVLRSAQYKSPYHSEVFLKCLLVKNIKSSQHISGKGFPFPQCWSTIFIKIKMRCNRRPILRLDKDCQILTAL